MAERSKATDSSSARFGGVSSNLGWMHHIAYFLFYLFIYLFVVLRVGGGISSIGRVRR